MLILSGDIGATNSRLALIEFQNLQQKWLYQEKFKNQKFQDFQAVLETFRKNSLAAGHDCQKIAAICVGAAGPVLDSEISITNLPWKIGALALQDFFQVKNVFLLNDLEAIAYAIPLVHPNDRQEILHGEPGEVGHQAVIAPGSGLGEAILFWNGKEHTCLPTEGGHCSFSPDGEVQGRLWQYLHSKTSPVGWESLISGPGLANLYSFLESENPELSSRPLLKSIDPLDISAAITQAAVNRVDILAQKTVSLFFEVLANESANLALKSLPFGGLYIAGGVAPRFSQLIDPLAFRKSFLKKDRMSNLLEKIPVHLILNDQVGMIGAARFAALKGS